MLNNAILWQIQTYALDMDWNVAFGGKAHGNRHLSRVVSIATFLAEKEEASREICEAGAWLHDIGLIAGNDDNPATIRQFAEEYLLGLGLDEEQIRRVAECAETHEGSKRAASLEARIVHDADVLDKMGVLGVIRHTWKVVNLIQPDASAQNVYDLVQTHLRERRERLYSLPAKRLVRQLNTAQHQFFADRRQGLKSIMAIMHEAKQGRISDEIARMLLLQNDNQSLLEQLTISHEILQWWYEQDDEPAGAVLFPDLL